MRAVMLIHDVAVCKVLRPKPVDGDDARLPLRAVRSLVPTNALNWGGICGASARRDKHPSRHARWVARTSLRRDRRHQERL